MKICLVCSRGGHLVEMLQIIDAFQGHDIFFAAGINHGTKEGAKEQEVKQIARAYFAPNIGANIWRLFKSLFWAFYILFKEKPDVIVSLGAEIALPFFYFGKLFGIKTIFIESWCRAENLSKTGQLVYPIADLFLVQWPQLLKTCGPKAQYKGSVI